MESESVAPSAVSAVSSDYEIEYPSISQPKPFYKRVSFWIILLIVILFIVGLVVGLTLFGKSDDKDDDGNGDGDGDGDNGDADPTSAAPSNVQATANMQSTQQTRTRGKPVPRTSAPTAASEVVKSITVTWNYVKADLGNIPSNGDDAVQFTVSRKVDNVETLLVVTSEADASTETSDGTYTVTGDATLKYTFVDDISSAGYGEFVYDVKVSAPISSGYSGTPTEPIDVEASITSSATFPMDTYYGSMGIFDFGTDTTYFEGLPVGISWGIKIPSGGSPSDVYFHLSFAGNEANPVTKEDVDNLLLEQDTALTVTRVDDVTFKITATEFSSPLPGDQCCCGVQQSSVSKAADYETSNMVYFVLYGTQIPQDTLYGSCSLITYDSSDTKIGTTATADFYAIFTNYLGVGLKFSCQDVSDTNSTVLCPSAAGSFSYPAAPKDVCGNSYSPTPSAVPSTGSVVTITATDTWNYSPPQEKIVMNQITFSETVVNNDTVTVSQAVDSGDISDMSFAIPLGPGEYSEFLIYRYGQYADGSYFPVAVLYQWRDKTVLQVGLSSPTSVRTL